MRIEEGVKLDYADVLLKPKRSRLLSRSEVTLARKFKFPHSFLIWEGVPIIAANMDTIGTFPVAEVMARHNMLTCVHKYYSEEEWREFAAQKSHLFSNLMISRGLEEIDPKIVQASTVNYRVAPIFTCIDVANGYSEALVEAVEKLRSKSRRVIIAGNVATPEMVTELILHGADIVKVGIGPGSVCTTRKLTGVGYPQLSAIAECADAAHAQNGHIIADGGCSDPGDVAKAFCAGADFVMLGGMLAGHDETSTEFYGMSSETAQEKYSGGVADYRASEGKHVNIPSRGPLENTIQQILGGLRSACTYIGAESLKDAPKTATFIRVNSQYNTSLGA